MKKLYFETLRSRSTNHIDEALNHLISDGVENLKIEGYVYDQHSEELIITISYFKKIR